MSWQRGLPANGSSTGYPGQPEASAIAGRHPLPTSHGPEQAGAIGFPLLGEMLKPTPLPVSSIERAASHGLAARWGCHWGTGLVVATLDPPPRAAMPPDGDDSALPLLVMPQVPGRHIARALAGLLELLIRPMDHRLRGAGGVERGARIPVEEHVVAGVRRHGLGHGSAGHQCAGEDKPGLNSGARGAQQIAAFLRQPWGETEGSGRGAGCSKCDL